MKTHAPHFHQEATRKNLLILLVTDLRLLFTSSQCDIQRLTRPDRFRIGHGVDCLIARLLTPIVLYEL